MQKHKIPGHSPLLVNISQGSVATRQRDGGTVNDNFITNTLPRQFVGLQEGHPEHAEENQQQAADPCLSDSSPKEINS